MSNLQSSDDGLAKPDPAEPSSKQKQIQNCISMINQCQINIENCSAEEAKNEWSDKMCKIRDGIQGFDIGALKTQTALKLSKLDKTKNILIKELQSLKAYCMDKADRAQQAGQDSSVIKQTIQILQEYIEQINTHLSYLLQEYLSEKLEVVAWIGMENDMAENFLDLQEALQQINYIQMNLDTIEMQFSAIKDTVINSQDTVTKIKIIKNVQVDLQAEVNDKFDMVQYIKDQINLLDSNKPSISVKKLSQHDFIIQGKRFQIKQPPVLTINAQTRLQDIIVKVGVSQ